MSVAGSAQRKSWSPSGYGSLVIETIQQRQQDGKPLARKAVRCDDPRVLYAAERRFGSWGKALAAAGVTIKEPGEIRT